MNYSFPTLVLQLTASLVVLFLATYAVVVTFGWLIAGLVYVLWCITNYMRFTMRAELERDLLRTVDMNP